MRYRAHHRAHSHGAARSALVVVASAGLLLSATAGALGAGGAGPPPTPVPPSGSLSPFPQSLRTPAPSIQAPHVAAAAAVLVDARTGQTLFARAAHASRAIASLTKVMTALVTVRIRHLSHVVTVGPDAAAATGSVLGLHVGEEIDVDELLHALLLQSSNDAALALADDISGSEDAFVARMDSRARQLGMRETRFASASGLDDRGFSTASDLAILARAALADRELAHVVRTKSFAIEDPRGPDREVQNRNALLWLYPGAIGVKTGYTSGAGDCLIAAATRGGRTLVAVVLGDSGDAVFDDAASLLNYGFHAFRRVTVLRAGTPLGTASVGGVPVAAVAASSLVALVRTDRIGQAAMRIELDPAVALPLAAGDRVGEAVVLDHGIPVGRVGALAATAAAAPSQTASPPPPPSPPPAERPPSPAPGPLDLIGSLLRATFGAIL
jgi:serine-type D-Ala-D-Ala carboxypeptidase (penicillin-binding protein 5/6)